MRFDSRIAVVIPALDEERSIGAVVDEIPAWVDDVVVVDNGSSDATARVARRHGARTVREPRRGYGAACQAGIDLLARSGAPDAVVFLDADGSDAPAETARLVDPILADRADLVVGRRPLRQRMRLHQRLGTRLVCALLRLGFRAQVTDIGPFRAVSWRTLQRIGMRDRRYGWTAEMQARALRFGERVAEVPVSWRPGRGRSKISGTWKGTLRAARGLVGSVLRELLAAQRDRLWAELRAPRPPPGGGAPSDGRQRTTARRVARVARPRSIERRLRSP